MNTANFKLKKLGYFDNGANILNSKQCGLFVFKTKKDAETHAAFIGSIQSFNYFKSLAGGATRIGHDAPINFLKFGGIFLVQEDSMIDSRKNKYKFVIAENCTGWIKIGHNNATINNGILEDVSI